MNEFNQKEAKKHFSGLGLRYFIFTLVVNIVQIVALHIASAIDPEIMNSESNVFWVSMLPIMLLVYPIWVLTFEKGKLEKSNLTKHKMSFGQFIAAFVMSYAAMYVLNMLGIGITSGIAAVKGSDVLNIGVELAENLESIPKIVVVTFLAPVFEELLFRKLIVDRTAQYGEGLAVILSASMFALFHGNLNQGIYVFGLGLFWAFIYVKTGHIGYTILIHSLINFMGSVVSVKVAGLVDIEEYVSALTSNDANVIMEYLSSNGIRVYVFVAHSMIVMSMVIIGIILFILFRKRFTFNTAEKQIPKGKRFGTTILNVGMMLYCIFWLVVTVAQLFINM